MSSVLKTHNTRHSLLSRKRTCAAPTLTHRSEDEGEPGGAGDDPGQQAQAVSQNLTVVLSKKKLNCPLNGNSLCTGTSLRWSARTYVQSGVHQPPPTERPLDGQLCRPSSQETPHRHQCAHSKEVLPPPPPHHPAPPLCGHMRTHTHTHTRTGVQGFI